MKGSTWKDKREGGALSQQIQLPVWTKNNPNTPLKMGPKQWFLSPTLQHSYSQDMTKGQGEDNYIVARVVLNLDVCPGRG